VSNRYPRKGITTSHLVEISFVRFVSLVKKIVTRPLLEMFGSDSKVPPEPYTAKLRTVAPCYKRDAEAWAHAQREALEAASDNDSPTPKTQQQQQQQPTPADPLRAAHANPAQAKRKD
jgi:hypothetical protein